MAVFAEEKAVTHASNGAQESSANILPLIQATDAAAARNY
jgi:hypothetical protein